MRDPGKITTRDPERIEPFLKEIGLLWKDNFPDWRFGQLMYNFTQRAGDVFYLEEEMFMVSFEAFCKGEDPREALTHHFEKEIEKHRTRELELKRLARRKKTLD